MSDARIQFLIEEALIPLRAELASLCEELSDLHAELHNAVAKTQQTTPKIALRTKS